PGRYVEVSGTSTFVTESNNVMAKVATGGSWIWTPPVSVDDRHPGSAPGHVPGLVTFTSRGPVCWGDRTLTVSVIVLPSADTVGFPIGVMSPAGPLKLTVAPGANRRPPSL